MSTTKTAAAGSDADQRGASETLKIENTDKRDSLQAVERRYQRQWQDEKVFESNAPSCLDYPPGSVSPEELRSKVPKFFCTMAYPYVNGTPHIGHAFTVSKVDFASRVARAQGKRTLYPQGFHATGMPIKACADKLAHEIGLFGETFDNDSQTRTFDEDATAPPTQAQTKEDVTKFSNVKKNKAALKTVKAKYQFQIMLALGIPRAEIHKFADAQYWLSYFPQLWQKHLVALGCGIDWRRSFITTDCNPYYDSFIRWQMRRLKELGKIRFGKRYTIYSPKDGQPCLDHDRSVGETVGVQEYTAIKCRVQKWSLQAQQALSGKIPLDSSVFMVPATLRPETMYGQANIFVSRSIMYGIFQVQENQYFLLTEKAARNMAFQGIFPQWGVYPKAAELKGSQIVGSVVRAPLSQRGEVYVVPMDAIQEAKGTGVVTSVPSDSPDDYAMTMELSKKAAFYGIKPDWVSLDLLPIIETSEYGNLTAPSLINKLKIISPKDFKQLKEAKELAYKEGFYHGKLVIGEFAGKSVVEAKGLVRQRLLDAGDALVYCEPDGLAISRSGDECVAAFLDQWYLTYGETDEAWRDDVLGHVRGEDGQHFNSFASSTRKALESTLGWITQWCVTRQYGLGTKLPWDESELVEGLSDSTIYMAYYTVAHYLHADIYGRQPGIGDITTAQLTDEVWDYVFALRDDVETDINRDNLEAMRREFTYWYPLDVRISGKDLINNHLVFFLYIHQAIWGTVAPQYLPKGIRLNGHVMLNGEKMSKSTGNFLTLEAAITKFGVDATRIALADGGDGVQDANFEEPVANAIVLKLFELRKWIEEVSTDTRLLKENEDYGRVCQTESIKNPDVVQRTGVKGFWDGLFENELNLLVQETVQQFDGSNYKAALKSGFYGLTAARDSYRVSTSSALIGMHNDCVRRYVELQALMLCVVAPHWAEYVWKEVLEKPTSIQSATFPEVPEHDPALTDALRYIRSISSAIGVAEGVQAKRIAKGKPAVYDPTQPKRLTVYVAKTWPTWQAKYVDLVRGLFDGVTLDVKTIRNTIDKSEMKKVMPFVLDLKQRLESGEQKESVFERDLRFDEVKVLQEMVPGLKATVPKLQDVVIMVVDEAAPAEGRPRMADTAEPGLPSFEFNNL